MTFNKHSNLEGQHAFLGASKYHWINYSDEKVANAYAKFLATVRGTELHEFAAQCIRLGQKLPRSNKTLNMYVNDAIGYKMTPEQVLYYSDNCFGTADAIAFRNGILRIHDLKTGSVPAHLEQLEIYAALFCLEYNKKPSEIRHTKESFVEILKDVDDYEIYCRGHENYPNTRAVCAIENIKLTYKEVLHRGDFLSEGRVSKGDADHENE